MDYVDRRRKVDQKPPETEAQLEGGSEAIGPHLSAATATPTSVAALQSRHDSLSSPTLPSLKEYSSLSEVGLTF